MQGMASHMRFAAIAFAILIVVGTLVLVGEEDSEGTLVRTAQSYMGDAESDRGDIEPIDQFGDDEPERPVQSEPPTEYADDNTDFADDEGLIDDAMGIDVEGFEPLPSIEIDQEVDAVDEMVIVEDDGSGS